MLYLFDDYVANRISKGWQIICRDHESLEFSGPKISPTITVKYLLCDSRAVLVRHSQAQKYLQINSKPLHLIAIKFSKFLFKQNILLTDYLSD